MEEDSGLRWIRLIAENGDIIDVQVGEDGVLRLWPEESGPGGEKA